MIDILTGIFKESFFLLNKMSPYLLFGFLFAGVLHVFLRPDMIGRHLGASTFSSVVKASLFGIPLPLCSCSVIPTAMSLRKEGASRGSVLSFLISTPTTGVDSIFATYALLGGIFTAYRIAASFITGVIAGALANLFIKEEPKDNVESRKCRLCEAGEEHAHTPAEKIRKIFTYSFGELLDDTGLPLILGILIGGVISFFLPETFIEMYLGSGMKSMIVMLAAGIPMYVCATASIPIAAALMLKGLAPGAAFVFLVAGPATNIVTMTVVGKNIGRAAVAIYLGSIVFCSLGMGLVLNWIYGYFDLEGAVKAMLHQHREIIPGPVGIAASAALAALIAYNLLTRRSRGMEMK